VEGTIAYVFLIIVSSPIGFIRWLIIRKYTLKQYIQDTEYNITALSIIGAIVITAGIFYRIYFVPSS